MNGAVDRGGEGGAATRDGLSSPQADPQPERSVVFDDEVLDAIVESASVDSQVDDLLFALASEIGPRLTGTAQSVEAELWAVEQFKSWGLEVVREPWGELAVGFERGKIVGGTIRPTREDLEFGSDAWTPGTHGQDGLEAGGPMRGQALVFPRNAAELREREPYLRDAWIMIPHGFEFPERRLRKQVERAFVLAPIAGYVHAAGDSSDERIVTAGDPELDPAKLPTRVEVRLRGDQHHRLLERMAAGDYVELEIAVGNRFLAGPIPVHNVIAELRGTTEPEQRVIVGGHLDSWDAGAGAIDNGTGVATTMEAARLLALACERTGQRPRRTIAFHLWTGEEQGLLGSQAWVEAHEAQLAQISAVLVHDNGTNYLSGISVTPELHALMQGVVEPLTQLAPTDFPFALELVEALPFEPSDSSSFLAAGVPSFFWAQSGRSDYERYHHTQFDQPEAVIDDYQRHSALVVAIAAWQLAQLPAPLPRENLSALPPRRIGVGLDGVEVNAVQAGSMAAAQGIELGDRIVSVNGVRMEDSAGIIAAIQHGGPSKRVGLERASPAGTERIEVEFDFSEDPDEARREARQAERRTRFGPELLPWDDQADGEAQKSDEG